MENKDLLDIWENGTDYERNMIKSVYRKVKGSFNTNSMTLYSGTRKVMRGKRQFVVYVIDIGVTNSVVGGR